MLQSKVCEYNYRLFRPKPRILDSLFEISIDTLFSTGNHRLKTSGVGIVPVMYNLRGITLPNAYRLRRKSDGERVRGQVISYDDDMSTGWSRMSWSISYELYAK